MLGEGDGVGTFSGNVLLSVAAFVVATFAEAVSAAVTLVSCLSALSSLVGFVSSDFEVDMANVVLNAQVDNDVMFGLFNLTAMVFGNEADTNIDGVGNCWL